MKYNYSVERVNSRKQKEVLQVVNCDSFDEAVKAVEKGVYSRELMEQAAEVRKDPGPPPSVATAAPIQSSGTGPISVPYMRIIVDREGNPIPQNNENNQ